ncbi:type VI secretion system-associated protein VasI [Litchfieldella rifensis]|uniref:Type VI secretion system-associated protein VasI n=1 Tax=Litchfieldella rifensis TaxID=762643 RepID=A0ABV7LQD6_9GAMM
MSLTFGIRPALLLCLAMGLGLESGALLANEVAPGLLENARECARQTSRLERLGCYDALFRVPEAVPDTGDPRPALWHAIREQEAARDGDDFGFLVSEANGDVLMSAPARGTSPPRPLLVISCEKAITRFQLHLSTASNAPRTHLRLTAAGRELEQDWRIRDGGYVISGGRGLPAIATLRQLLDGRELELGSDLAELDGLRFDLTGLRERIQPLRDTCRW